MGKGKGRGRGRGRGRGGTAGAAETKPGTQKEDERQQVERPNNQNRSCLPAHDGSTEAEKKLKEPGTIPKHPVEKNDKESKVSDGRSTAAVANRKLEETPSACEGATKEASSRRQDAVKPAREAEKLAVATRKLEEAPSICQGATVAKEASSQKQTVSEQARGAEKLATATRKLEEAPSLCEGATVGKEASSQKQTASKKASGADKLAGEIQALSISGTGASSASTKPRNGGVSTQLLKRPGFGQQGRRIKLTTNFVRMEIPRIGDIYHYDVAVLPEKCPRKVNSQVIAAMVDAYQKIFSRNRPVFDGKKNLYSKEPLPIGNNAQEFTVKIRDEQRDREREFKVTIKLVARVSLQTLDEGLRGRTEIPKDTIQALEVVLRMAPSARYIPVGRSFFSEPEPGTAINLGSGCEIWYGSYQSIRPTQWGMLLNIDQATTAFYKSQRVIDYLKECFPKCDLFYPLRDTERIQFQKKIKGFKVEFTYIAGQKRQKRITGISKESAKDIMFDYETDGKKRRISVAQYFAEKYNIRLSFPNLQCLKAGSDRNIVHLPMEVCKIVPGQRVLKKLDEKQTSIMIKDTAKDAMDRKSKIEKRVAEANFDEDPHLRDFDMRVGKNLLSIEGRVLQPPNIQLAQDSRTVTPRDGKWDMRGAAFFEGKKIDRWGLLICASERFCNENTVMKFCFELNKASSNLKMPINKDPSYVKYLHRSMTLSGLFDDVIHKVPDIELLLVILDGGLYAEVKALADTTFGIITQCIKVKNVTRANPQLLANLCMKINAKMNGVNGFCDKVCRPPRVFERPVIFLGADVTHPSPGDTTKPSVAAVVGSLDAHPMRYAARVRAQAHRKEIITDLTLMTKELLQEFYRATRHEPAKIIMYRDGVSEGQFSQVLQFELKAIQQACLELSKTYRPAITFITVQKRHHVRLFAENERDQIGKSRNIPAGTVVDRAICHPSEFDFYLCSHNGIQGTSRPSHYRVLSDDSKFTADELQQLTYALCHNYARCTRSVSIPPPAYYAHHVAMRANYHIQAMESSSNGSSNESQAGSVNLDAVNNNLESAIKIHQNLLSRMYFI